MRVDCHHRLLLLTALVASTIGAACSFVPSPRPSPSSSTTRLSAVKFEYTHTEVNGMLWNVPEADLSLVIDPIASELNFGIPWGLYRANLRALSEEQVLDMIVKANPSYCLLSQGLDDHTHLPTLSNLLKRLPHLKFIVAPSASEKLAAIVDDKTRITVLSPGSTTDLPTNGKVECQLTAVEGSLTGPPWQARENGWLLKVIPPKGKTASVFYEPHADIQDGTLREITADVAIVPVKKQALPAFTLVYGGERSLQIANQLGASTLIPLGNGDLVTTGLLSQLVTTTGSVDECEQMIVDVKPEIQRPSPGVPLTLTID